MVGISTKAKDKLLFQQLNTPGRILQIIQKTSEIGRNISQFIPVVGASIAALDKVVSTMLNEYQNGCYKSRVSAIKRIIQSKFDIDDDISVTVAKMAISFTKMRELEIFEELNRKEDTKKQLRNFNKLINKINKQIFQQKTTNRAENLAVRDVCLILAYMIKHSDEILEIKENLVDFFYEVGTNDSLVDVIET